MQLNSCICHCACSSDTEECWECADSVLPHCEFTRHHSKCWPCLYIVDEVHMWLVCLRDCLSLCDIRAVGSGSGLRLVGVSEVFSGHCWSQLCSCLFHLSCSQQFLVTLQHLRRMVGHNCSLSLCLLQFLDNILLLCSGSVTTRSLKFFFPSFPFLMRMYVT